MTFVHPLQPARVGLASLRAPARPATATHPAPPSTKIYADCQPFQMSQLLRIRMLSASIITRLHGSR